MTTEWQPFYGPLERRYYDLLLKSGRELTAFFPTNVGNFFRSNTFIDAQDVAKVRLSDYTGSTSSFAK